MKCVNSQWFIIVTWMLWQLILLNSQAGIISIKGKFSFRNITISFFRSLLLVQQPCSDVQWYLQDKHDYKTIRIVSSCENPSGITQNWATHLSLLNSWSYMFYEHMKMIMIQNAPIPKFGGRNASDNSMHHWSLSLLCPTTTLLHTHQTHRHIDTNTHTQSPPSKFQGTAL